ncbi:MAG: site-specific DNA-methyltransferase [Verrucomicrobiota bacterium]
MPARKKTSSSAAAPQAYSHPEASSPARPEIGAQSHFRKTKPPTQYRYDSSLAPELVWDEGNPAREQAEALIARLAEDGLRVAELALMPPGTERDAEIQELTKAIQEARRRLAGISGPFLNWTGKAERPAFEVPTLPLFIHERLSTSAILDTLAGHKRDLQDNFLSALFGSEGRSLHDQVLKAYEYPDKWVNRMILGDSQVVMNSLLQFENMAGKVQMIYMDPPYGVKFGSNFQPFIRKRDVKHNEDEDLTREPEMVQAYRDTWELGIHSYLTYLRDRLRVSRELLNDSGSVFVQISDDNLHHVREVMDEVFGAENFVSVITVKKTTSASSQLLPVVSDFLLWYGRDVKKIKYRQTYSPKRPGEEGAGQYNYVEETNGTRRQIRRDESFDEAAQEGKLFCHDNFTSQRPPGDFPVEFDGLTFRPGKGYWKTGIEGMERLKAARRMMVVGNTLRYVRFISDFPVFPFTNLWDDTVTSGFDDPKLYVVQTNKTIAQRCVLMTTDPGDLILDPTCGSGTTAFVAEQWGRRWITCDTSRVPLALARQRLLTAAFDYHELKDENRGPIGGFVYKRKQNRKGEEIGGIVPHITLKSIANNEPPQEEILVDRPETVKGVTRVAGPFVFEATIPTAEGLDQDPVTPGIQSEEYQNHVERMTEVLRRAPVLRLPGNQTVTLKQIRPPAKTLALSAEAVIDAPTLNNLAENASSQPGMLRDQEAVAILFGPENGAISERMVREAWDEAGLKRYSRLFVIGFGIDPKAREFIDNAGKIGIAAFYLQATMDLQMGDLLKNMRSSHVFSVCGLPDIQIHKAKPAADKTPRWQVELLGLETFDPVTMEADSMKGKDVPAWFLDSDYNGMVFRVRQAFFPRTGAWEKLKKSLKVEFEDGVWDHLAGTTSAPFEAGEQRRVAVKVIDPRGNELLVVKKLEVLK